MVKDYITYYSVDRVPLSLGQVPLHKGQFVEDIFYAVADAEDFDDLTVQLHSIISVPFDVCQVSDKYIRYLLIDTAGNTRYLKIKIKGDSKK
jgi:hypothetical protein